MMRYLLGTITIIAALLLGISPASATLTLSLDAGTGPVTVVDGLDGGPVDGIVAYNSLVDGPLDPWKVTMTAGFSKPLLGSDHVARLHLDSVDVSGGSGTLQITLVDTDYNASAASIFDQGLFSAGGYTDGSVEFVVAIDDANDTNPFDGTEIYNGTLQGGAFKTTGWNMLGDLADSFSMGIIATIKHGPSSGGPFDRLVTSFDADLRAVPEPSVLALMGIGLLGIGFARKKKSPTK